MESKIDTKNELKYKPKKKNNIFLTKNFIFSFLFHDITSTTNSNIIKNSCRLMLIDDFVFQVLQEFDLIYYEDPE